MLHVSLIAEWWFDRTVGLGEKLRWPLLNEDRNVVAALVS